jgi:outer membrane immunogenic protein
MFAPNWDVFVEYDHMWLGNKTLTFTSPPGCHESITQRLDKVLIGVNYRFALGR